MPRPKIFAIVLALGLAATACGGTDQLEGDAIRVAVESDQFCIEAYDPIWGDFSSDAMRPDNAQDFAIAIQRVLGTIPSDAPRELRRTYETFEEIAILSVNLPVGDPATMDDAAQRRYRDIDAAIGELEAFDQDVISTYVAAACPTQYASRGFLTIGSTGQSSPAATAATPVSTQVPVATTTPSNTATPTTEPTLDGVRTSDLEVTLNIGRYDGVDVELFGARATNASPESLLAGEPVADPDGQNWLLVHVGLTNDFSTQIWFQRGAFRLITPDDRSAVEEERFDDRGREGAFSSIKTREFVEGFIAFPTRDLVSDLSDWVFVVDQEDGVPEVIPLAETYVNPYPVDLATGATVVVRQEASDDFGGCSNPVGEWEAEVTEAFVHTDPLSGSGVRVPSGERWVTVRLFATNVGPLKGNVYCDLGAELGGNMDLRLAVDGRSTGNLGSYGYDAQQIATGESTTMRASFRVAAGASTLALITGEDNEVQVEWQVELPLVLDR